MKSICVLMSTYNGEKYLEEQIKSLINQKDVEMHILVRDDGSKDRTIDILKEFSKKYDFFEYYQGENVGPAQSFFDLIKKCNKYDYYAFCDQDDVWDDDKLIVAINMLEKEEQSKPNMYYSNLRIVDKDLVFYRLSHSNLRIQKNKYSALTEDMATGCTVVFNSIAREYAKNNIPEYCSMHDTWIYLICKFFGQTVYDFAPHISYRQHGNNVVGTYLGKKTMSIYISRIKRLFNRSLQPRYNNAKNFYKYFGKELNEKDIEKVKKIVEYKKSFWKKMVLLFDKDICASSKDRNMRFKFLIILGIV